jgi:hypothetical protein
MEIPIVYETMRCVDVSSNHNLLVSAVRLRLKRYNNINNNARKKLKCETAQE